jgi:hypothetical protein
MDPRLHAICLSHGAFLKSEAADLGYSDKAITAAVRAKAWHRIRRGAYTLVPLWVEATPEERHRILCRAVLRSLAPNVVLSHVSALVERQVAVWNVDLSRVHVTRLDGRPGSVEPDVIHHEGVATEQDFETVNGLPVMRTARSLFEASTRCGVEEGLVMADSALHRGLVSAEEFERAFHATKRWPGTRSAQLIARLADGRAASPGESRVRYICWEQGLPQPELQFRVYDAYGGLIGIVDLAWAMHQLLCEFDGLAKYGRLLKPGETAGDVIAAEKVREDRLREATGFGMVRILWRHLDDHAQLAARVRRNLRLPA